MRQKLDRKAKQQKRDRCYSLYALGSRRDVWQAVLAAGRRNDGASGVDGMSLDQISSTPESEAAFLNEIERSLKEKTHRAQPVRRVHIPKANVYLHWFDHVFHRADEPAQWAKAKLICSADDCAVLAR